MQWHRNGFIYDISTVHKHIWSTPTKTYGASRRQGKNKYIKFQPGGVLTVVAKGLTSKIQSVETDSLGRWAKTRFFDKNSTFVIYTIYRPNPGSLGSLEVNSVWMQQYRALNKKNNTNFDPRAKFIEDIIADVSKDKAMNGYVLIASDFNEDISENKLDGVLKLMESCSLKNVFQEIKGYCPNTRNNNRAIDHFLISEEVFHLVTQVANLPNETSFACDHAGLIIDVSPKYYNITTNPLSHRNRGN